MASPIQASSSSSTIGIVTQLLSASSTSIPWLVNLLVDFWDNPKFKKKIKKLDA